MAFALGTAEIKARLSELVERVRSGGERLVVLRRGRPVAAIVNVEDLRRLEALDAASEDARDDGRHPAMRAYGAWADEPGLDDLVRSIYEERAAYVPRDASL